MVTHAKPFEQVLTEVQERTRERNPIDVRKPLFTFEVMFPDGAQPYLQPRQADGGVVMLPPIALAPLALKQLLEKVRYPRQLLERLPNKYHWMNVNHLILHEEEEKMALLRLVGGGTEARAILGSRYTPLDDLELLSVAADFIHGATVRWEAFTETTSHLTVTWPAEKETERQAGLERGLHIANSEVGLRAVTIEAVAWRRVCNNILPALGMGGDESFLVQGSRLYSRGDGGDHAVKAKAGDVKSSWRFIHTGDSTRLRDFVRDAVADTKRQYDGLLAAWKAGLAKAVDDPIGAIQEMAETRGHTAEELKAALDAWADTKPHFGATVTGIANAFTLGAQQVEDPDRRYFMASTGTRVFRVGLS